MKCSNTLALTVLVTLVSANIPTDRPKQPPEQQEPVFGVSQGARLDSVEQPTVKQLVFSQESSRHSTTTSSASDLYHLAVSLLDSLTAHAPPSSSTTTTPLLSHQPQSRTRLFDSIEARLGPTSATVLRTTRSALSYLYAGSNSKRPAAAASTTKDLSLRGAVTGLKNLVTNYAAWSGRSLPGRTKGPKGWQAKLEAASGLRSSHVMLDQEEVGQAMNEVLRLARQAAEAGSAEAWLLLGDLHLSGHLTLRPNATAAAKAYTAASEGWGLPEAQYKLGFLYGTNYDEAFGRPEGEGDQGSALLHYTFAALSRHPAASMTVGYRHWVGLGVKKSCKDALNWYKAAADQAMIAFNAGPPGGRHLSPPKSRLSDLQGGVYGPGASASSMLQSSGGTPQREWNDLLEYYQFHADQGDLRDMYKLGRLYYQGFGGNGLGGTRGGRGRLDVGQPGLQDRLHDGGRDFAKASKWFMALATKVWRKDPPREAVTNPKISGERKLKSEAPKLFYDGSKDLKLTKEEPRIVIGSLAAGHLGKMYLRGEGTTANYAKAFLWFQRGAAHGDRESNNGLGIMYRDGLGVPRDLPKANLYFHAAAQQDLAEAQVNLGKYHFGMGEYATATTYFEHAMHMDGQRQPDTFQSHYYLAELNARAVNHEEQCPLAVSFYKLIAERGDWDHEVWWEAQRAYSEGDERKAFLGFWIMAERGYEPAQNNIAFMLDRDKQRLRLPFIDIESPSNASDRLALAYWTRSAAQDNVDALVKMGDYYFAGMGTDQPQFQRAAACYQSATMTRTSAMALWNLGWMHEHGKGVAQDYHLAKRYYDQASETSPHAYLPSTLSLVGLYARALYDIVFQPSKDNSEALSLFSDVVSFPSSQHDTVDGESVAKTTPPASPPPSWTASRVWREIQRRWGYDVPEDQEDAIRAEAAAAAAAQQAGAGQRERADQRVIDAAGDKFEWQHGDDGFSASDRRKRDRGRVGEEDEDEDEYDFLLDGEGDFGGTVAIVALCVILAWLLYFRQGRIPQDRPVRRVAGEGRPPEHEERLV